MYYATEQATHIFSAKPDNIVALVDRNSQMTYECVS
jgi:hypothetical protein